jgi:hypothetical protein
MRRGSGARKGGEAAHQAAGERAWRERACMAGDKRRVEQRAAAQLVVQRVGGGERVRQGGGRAPHEVRRQLRRQRGARQRRRRDEGGAGAGAGSFLVRRRLHGVGERGYNGKYFAEFVTQLRTIFRPALQVQHAATAAPALATLALIHRRVSGRARSPGCARGNEAPCRNAAARISKSWFAPP